MFFRSAKLFMSAGSSEEDIDDIIDEICNESSFAKTPLVSRSAEKCRVGELQRWKEKHHKLELF